MKVSIITVSFNAEKTVRDTIESVLNQSYEDIEYIIIDGGSTDKTNEIVQEYASKIAVHKSEKDEGLYDAMNKGLALVTGELIGILNADDLYSDNKVISDVVMNMRASKAEGLYADLVYVDEKNTSKITRTWVSGMYQKDAFKKGWMPPHPTFFVRKSCYQKYGTFNTDFKTSADYELMLRFIHKFEITITYLPRTIIKMRTGGQSNASLKNRLKANKEDRNAWKVNGLKADVFTFIRKPLSKISQFIKK